MSKCQKYILNKSAPIILTKVIFGISHWIFFPAKSDTLLSLLLLCFSCNNLFTQWLIQLCQRFLGRLQGKVLLRLNHYYFKLLSYWGIYFRSYVTLLFLRKLALHNHHNHNKLQLKKREKPIIYTNIYNRKKTIYILNGMISYFSQTLLVA